MIAPVSPPPHATGALALDTYELTKRFGAFTAMDHVTMHVEAGTVHALLGENGAGKSTLVKCVAGFQRPEEGAILIDGREHDIATPVIARAARHRHGLPALHAGARHDRGREPAARRRPHAGADRLEDASAPTSRPSSRPRPSASTWTRGPGAGRRREAEARTAQAALPRAAPPDPRRADLGADAAGGRRGAGLRARSRPARRCAPC